MRFHRAFLTALVAVSGLFASASAGAMMTSLDAQVSFNGSDDNGAYSIPIFSGPLVVGPGIEVSQTIFRQNTNGGFQGQSNQIFGSVTVNASDSAITVGFIGQAQSGAFDFSFTNLSFLPPSVIVGSGTTNSGVMNGVNMANTPSVGSSSVTGMGFFLFGFQPGTDLSQTTSLELGIVPEPSTLSLVLMALPVLAWAGRRRP